MLLQKLEALEKMIEVPNVEKHPIEALRAMEILNCIVELREIAKNLQQSDVIKSVCDCRICDTYETDGIVRCRNCGRKKR